MKFKNLLLILIALFSTKAYSQDKDKIELGGCLRFNYIYSSWKDDQKDRGGDLVFDVFRLNAKGSIKGVRLDFDYRFYAAAFGGGMLKHGFMAYDFSEKSSFELGLNQVPFGIQAYNSHSWFFSMPFYIGFEDDYDMGMKYIFDNKKLQFTLAYYKGSEDLFSSDEGGQSSRYAYDIVGVHRESNRVNGKILARFGANNEHEIGASGAFGQIYDTEEKDNGTSLSTAFHYEYKGERLGIKLQGIYYKFSLDSADRKEKTVRMGAYASGYDVAAEGQVYTIGIKYKLPLNHDIIDELVFYNDYSLYQKKESDYEASQMNITGCMVVAGPLYFYFDYGLGKNQPWIGGDWNTSLGAGDKNADWEYRINFNLGYYF